MDIRCKCKDCNKRKSGCHSTCEDYKEFRKMMDKMNKKIRSAIAFQNIGYTPKRRKNGGL